jgi:3-dehydroquinate synthase
MRKVNVSLAERSYPILIAPGLISRIGVECARLKFSGKCAVISDTNVARLYGKTAMRSLKFAGFDPVLITVPAGETSKNLKIVHACYDKLAAHRIERKSFIVALGGGVVGDPRDLSPPRICAASVLFRSRQRSSRRWTVRLAEKSASI